MQGTKSDFEKTPFNTTTAIPLINKWFISDFFAQTSSALVKYSKMKW